MSIAAPISHPFLTKEDQAIIRSTVSEFTRSGRLHLDSDGLPPYAVQTVVSVLDSLAEGQDVRVPPPQAEVTVAQAARFLDMSEECVYGLFQHGALEYHQEGDRYWINRNHLIEYEEECRRRHESLNVLTRLSQEMGAYDL